MAFPVASRLLRGWVAGIEWLLECKRVGWKLQPVLRLGCAASVPRELHLHKSPEFATIINQIVSAECELQVVHPECRKNLQLIDPKPPYPLYLGISYHC